jgi:hypothetical protein
MKLINVSTNIKEVTKNLKRKEKKQIPFATMIAINDTLFQLRKEMGKQTIKKLDRPTPFTQKGFMVRKANKKNLLGMLFIKKDVAKYLKYQIEGGVRSSNKKIGVPTGKSKLNKYGNIPGRKKGLIRNKKQKIMTIKDMTGVFEEHKDRTLSLMVAFKDRVVYPAIFPFYKIGQKFISSVFDKNFRKALDKALRTAK